MQPPLHGPQAERRGPGRNGGRWRSRLGGLTATGWAALALAACGLGAGMTFAEAKSRVAEMMDRTVEAVLAGLPVERMPTLAPPCREAFGQGAATGEYKPAGGLRFELPAASDGRDLVRDVQRFWEEEGYRVEVDLQPGLPRVTSEAGDDFGMAFQVVGDRNEAILDGSGPCLEPESEAERDSPLELRSLERAPELGAG